ncbi:GntR family transcriptional regulator [Thalassobaculum sp.]|uniref:GntR family transcriptional regulator n=1 Tax=Thalassobaculum sp. TaxID=2022740 RepID=UPI0032EE9308
MALARRPLARATLSVQIAERIRDDILSGAYPPGAQLHEVELAVGFGVSRGPLREAMQRLVQEGLLRSEPHRGMFVPDLTEADLLDVFFVRTTLEVAALRRVAAGDRRRAVADTLAGIADRMDRAMKAGDWAAGGELDFAFHRSLVDAAGSERLSRTYTTVQAETRLCLHRLMGGYRSSAHLAVEHHRLAGLIAEAPVEAAVAELQKHLADPARYLRKVRAAAQSGHGSSEQAR